MYVCLEVLQNNEDPNLIIKKRVYTAVTLVGYAVIVGLTWPFALVYVPPHPILLLNLRQPLILSIALEHSP